MAMVSRRHDFPATLSCRTIPVSEQSNLERHVYPKELYDVSAAPCGVDAAPEPVNVRSAGVEDDIGPPCRVYFVLEGVHGTADAPTMYFVIGLVAHLLRIPGMASLELVRLNVYVLRT